MFVNICYDYVKECSNDFLLLLYLMFKDDPQFNYVTNLISERLNLKREEK